jgi:hypothetical protein
MAESSPLIAEFSPLIAESLTLVHEILRLTNTSQRGNKLLLSVPITFNSCNRDINKRVIKHFLKCFN